MTKRIARHEDLPGEVDEIAVERACRGEKSVRLNRSEMRAAYETLQARGLSANQIAARLGVAARTVTRWRAGAVTPGSRGVPPRPAKRAICGECGDPIRVDGMQTHRRRVHPETVERVAS